MRFTALPTANVRALQNGDADAYGVACEVVTSDGDDNPCRHCLRNIPEGSAMLILAYRPFKGLHAYAETGPVFLCAKKCARGGGTLMPQTLTTSSDYLLKGYCPDDRIVYGTGKIVKPVDIPDQVKSVFSNSMVAYIHVRSARNNCYQLRIDRGEPTLAAPALFGHKKRQDTAQAKDTPMSQPAPETKVVNTYRIACDGSEGALGHPRVWLQIPKETGFVECGYCDCKYIHADFEGKV